MEQTLQHITWIFPTWATKGSTQGNWVAHSSLNTLLIFAYFFFLFVGFPKTRPRVKKVDAYAPLTEVDLLFVFEKSNKAKVSSSTKLETPKVDASMVSIDPSWVLLVTN